MFEGEFVDEFFEVVEPLWTDSDRFKQRAAAEMITGLVRGVKHWSGDDRERVWSWVSPRLPRIFSQMKLDTNFWESLYSVRHLSIYLNVAHKEFRLNSTTVTRDVTNL